MTKDPRSVNWWSNYPKYSVSLLKALWGDKATKENDFGYAWLPKLDPGQNCSWLNLFDVMYDGKIKGFFCLGTKSGLLRRERQQGAQGAGQARLAGKRQHLRQRDRFLLERAGHGPQDHQDRSLYAARGRVHRKRGKHHQQRPMGSVAVQGGRSARLRPNLTATCMYELMNQDQRTLQEGRQIPRSDSESQVGLCGREGAL